MEHSSPLSIGAELDEFGCSLPHPTHPRRSGEARVTEGDDNEEVIHDDQDSNASDDSYLDLLGQVEAAPLPAAAESRSIDHTTRALSPEAIRVAAVSTAAVTDPHAANVEGNSGPQSAPTTGTTGTTADSMLGNSSAVAGRQTKKSRVNAIIDQLARSDDADDDANPHSRRRPRVFTARWSCSRMERSTLAQWFVPKASTFLPPHNADKATATGPTTTEKGHGSQQPSPRTESGGTLVDSNSNAQQNSSTAGGSSSSSPSIFGLLPSSREVFRKKWFGLSFASDAVEDVFLMFLYRGRRSFLSLGCATVAVMCLACSVAMNAFETLWVGLTLCLVGSALVGVGSVNFIWFVLSKSYERSDASKLATTRLYEHFCTAFGVIGMIALSILYYPLAVICLDVGRYDNVVGVPVSGTSYFTGSVALLSDAAGNVLANMDPCVDVIGPLHLVTPIILAVLLPLRAVYSVPLILISPFLVVLMHVWFPVATAINVWEHFACIMVFCLGAAWIAASNDNVSRQLFKEDLLLKANAKRSFRVREELDKAMEALLPKYIVERMAARRTGLDYTTYSVVMVSQAYDFASWSTTLLPADVVHVMNALYVTFDEIASRYEVDKMKALGDRYILSSGLQRNLRPTPAYEAKCDSDVKALSRDERRNRESAIRMLRVAFLQLTVLAQLNIKIESTPLRFRIAAHCGPLLGTIVGSHSITYEIFGPTLQTTLQMAANVPYGMVISSEELFKNTDGYFEGEAMHPALVITLAHSNEEVELGMIAVSQKRQIVPSREERDLRLLQQQQQQQSAAHPIKHTTQPSTMTPHPTSDVVPSGAASASATPSPHPAMTAVKPQSPSAPFLMSNPNIEGEGHGMRLPPELAALLGEAKRQHPVGTGVPTPPVSQPQSPTRQQPNLMPLGPPKRRSRGRQSKPYSSSSPPTVKKPVQQDVDVLGMSTSSADAWTVRHTDVPTGVNARILHMVSFYQQTRYQILLDSVRREQARPGAVKLCMPAELLKTSLELTASWGEEEPRSAEEDEEVMKVRPRIHSNDVVMSPANYVSLPQPEVQRHPNPLATDHGSRTSNSNLGLDGSVDVRARRRITAVEGGQFDSTKDPLTQMPRMQDRFLFGRELFVAVARESKHIRQTKWWGLVQYYRLEEIENAFDEFQIQTYRAGTIRAYIIHSICFAMLFIVGLFDIAYRTAPDGRGSRVTVAVQSILSGGDTVERGQMLHPAIAFPFAVVVIIVSCGRALLLKRHVWLSDQFDSVLVLLLMVLSTLSISALPELSLVNIDLQYWMLYWLLITGAIVRFWYHAAFVSASIAATVFACQSQRSIGVPSSMYIFFFPVMIGVCAAAYYKETYNRSHYQAWWLSSTLLRAAEDEVAIQRAVQMHMFPRHVLSVVNKLCLGSAESETVFLQSISDLITLEIRLDCLTALVYKERDEPVAAVDFAEKSFFLIESLVQQSNDAARQRNPRLLGTRDVVFRVHSCGDTILYAGPLDDLEDDDGEDEEVEEGESTSTPGGVVAGGRKFSSWKRSTVSSAASVDRRPKAKRNAAGSPKTKDAEREEWEVEERRSWEAARCVIEIVHGLKALQRPDDNKDTSPTVASSARYTNAAPSAAAQLVVESNAASMATSVYDTPSRQSNAPVLTGPLGGRLSPMSMTAIVCCGSGFGSVLGSRRVTFNIFGVVTRQSHTLMEAAPPGFTGCTNTFRKFFESSGATLPIQGVDLALGAPQQWCMRGSGVITMIPLLDSALVAQQQRLPYLARKEESIFTTMARQLPSVATVEDMYVVDDAEVQRAQDQFRVVIGTGELPANMANFNKSLVPDTAYDSSDSSESYEGADTKAHHHKTKKERDSSMDELQLLTFDFT